MRVGNNRIILTSGGQVPRTKRNNMKAIKNMNGLIKSLKYNGYDVLQHTRDMVIVRRPFGDPTGTIIHYKHDLQNLYLRNGRLSYMDVFKNCDNNIVIDVCFY